MNVMNTVLVTNGAKTLLNRKLGGNNENNRGIIQQ